MAWGVLGAINIIAEGNSSPPLDTTGADLFVVAYAGVNNSGVNTQAPRDSEGNTYIPAADGSPGNFGALVQLWYCFGPVNDSSMIWSTGAGGSDAPNMYVTVLSGSDGGPFADAVNTNGSGNANPVQPGP